MDALRIAARLAELDASLRGDEGIGLDKGSMQALLGFAAAAKGWRAPSLSASPAGLIHATWGQGEPTTLDVKFASQGPLHFALRSPGPDGRGPTRIWGSKEPAELAADPALGAPWADRGEGMGIVGSLR